jgi:hypothetical protein
MALETPKWGTPADHGGAPYQGGFHMKLRRAAITLVLVSLALLIGLRQFSQQEARRLSSEVRRLEQEREELVRSIERLCASRRVAQLNVLRQFTDERGLMVTEVRWQEIGDGGLLGEPRVLTVHGSQVYVEALVLKFDQSRVAKGELSANGAVLFRRVFGEWQAPERGERLNGLLPAADPRDETLEPTHWDRFWEFVDDPRLAARYGVRVAQLEAPAVPVKVGQTWEISVDAIGGINLRRLDGADGWRMEAPPAVHGVSSG